MGFKRRQQGNNTSDGETDQWTDLPISSSPRTNRQAVIDFHSLIHSKLVDFDLIFVLACSLIVTCLD
jgi:hypothetical protein